MRGRKPKPTSLRSEKRESVTPDPAIPTKPGWLTTEAKREWSRVVPALDEMGLLAEIDRSALAMYCQEWGRYVDAQKEISKYGPVLSIGRQLQPSPYLSIARNALKACASLCAEFGLTPTSRGRMRMPVGRKPPRASVSGRRWRKGGDPRKLLSLVS